MDKITFDNAQLQSILHALAASKGSNVTVVTMVGVIVAIFAAFIAALQMVIARQKLNHDLFDKRFAVYVATQDYLAKCINNDGGTREDTGAFYAAIRSAPFLFDRKTNDFLGEVMQNSINMQVFGKHTNKPELPDYQRFVEIHLKSMEWVASEFPKLADRFQNSINLSSIKPFSMTRGIKIPELQQLRENIQSTLKG